MFAPPNVKGWDGGVSWITTNNLLARYNEAAMLVQGDVSVLRGMNLGGPKMAAAACSAEPDAKSCALTAVDVNKILTPKNAATKRAPGRARKTLPAGKLKEKQEHALRDYLDSKTVA